MNDASGTRMSPDFDAPELGWAMLRGSPLPVAALEGATHIVRYVNPAFCILAGNTEAALLNRKLAESVPISPELTALFDSVYRTGHAETRAGQEGPAAWSSVVSSLAGADGRRIGIVLQVTESIAFGRHLRAVNEALLLTSLRQHETAEVADALNRKLEAEIRERSYAEAELQRANNDLKEFAYAASHDLQEPLRTVMVFTQLLTRKLSPHVDEEAARFTEHISSGIKRMQLLIQDLLAYALAGVEELSETQGAECSAALQVALGNLGGLIQETGARIVADPLPRVDASARQLAEIFQNLIGNALKYNKPNCVPEIQIAAERNGRQWVISVRDNGIGFAQEYAEQIFRVFKRLHSKDCAGTGIGLAICRRIVERQRGTIWATSEEGVGTVFSFSLPA